MRRMFSGDGDREGECFVHEAMYPVAMCFWWISWEKIFCTGGVGLRAKGWPVSFLIFAKLVYERGPHPYPLPFVLRPA